jgi:RHS repeat-associated protein
MRYYQTLETDLYFYHPDHLSSASWITDSGGLPMQHLQYMPFGETRVDQRATGSNWSTRYSFSAKEMDEESRYHYFGARYYDSDLSIFLSMDPMASKYPSLTPYAYVANNPIKLVDPNGEEIWITGADGSKTLYTQGMKYEGGDKFVGKAVNALNKLNGTKFGGKVIGMLAESKTNNVDIISATKSEWNSTISRDESGNKTGMNGTLSWNENGTDLWVEGNAYSELAKNPVTDMGHEFAHAFDDMMDVSLPIDKIEDVSKHEWMAVYRENIMRKELKLPYRTYFGNTDGPRMVQKGVPYLPFSYPHINK